MPLALPTCAERQQALQACCSQMALAPDVDLAQVAGACNGYAAADLLALAREAAMQGVRRAAAASAPGGRTLASRRAVMRRPSAVVGRRRARLVCVLRTGVLRCG